MVAMAYVPSAGAFKRVQANNKSIENLTSLRQLPLVEVFSAAARLGLVTGNEQYIREQLRHAGHFALLSIQMKFATNAALAANVMWHDLSGESTDKANVTRLRKEWVAKLPKGEGHRGNLLSVSVRGCIEWDRRVRDEGLALLKGSAETWMSYRDRLDTGYGIAPKVASFIALLLYPMSSELATIDTWMGEVLGFVKVRPTASPTPRQYDVLQAKLAAKGAELGYTGPLGLFQWMVWDWSQGKSANTWEHHDHHEASLI